MEDHPVDWVTRSAVLEKAEQQSLDRDKRLARLIGNEFADVMWRMFG